ncbi:Rhodanese-like domain-containing protein [Catenaria anguillulae PL171]|uniref:Rhodanese-like domain-containing protein n=1 Tax=Catenaria anguillulae PL171 TaxID=765915 RepID=A0A1Y2I1E1_9FUNG|nr:Rhodanese-like domain-containing protein [Catenaria anguillulae PL171]
MKQPPSTTSTFTNTMTNSPDPHAGEIARRIQVADLLTLVRDPTLVPGKDYLVVDVRDADYKDNKIRGSLNVPSKSLADPNVAKAKAQQLANIPKLIFHCGQSQHRAPNAAKNLIHAMPKDATAEVLVLTGGIVAWREQHGDLVEPIGDEDKKADH